MAGKKKKENSQNPGNPHRDEHGRFASKEDDNKTSDRGKATSGGRGRAADQASDRGKAMSSHSQGDKENKGGKSGRSQGKKH